MITVIASISVVPDKVVEFVKLFNENVANVLAEEGCIEYYPTVDIESGLEVQQVDPSVVTIIECWESVEALRAHLQTPHMQHYREQTKDLVKEVRLKVLQPV
ncbi:MAG: putative quinol monooxygenase [Desulfocapsaceae bacterium]|jgi:quinol monooxygenase YgiN|nr:putative quinol monooxygenase [Desulfocapsaceae bacterium]